MINAILDGNKTYAWGESAIAAVVAIVLVFVVLLLIIGLTYLIFKLLGYFEIKKEIDEMKKSQSSKESVIAPATLDENDEDMVAAVLVATIDYRNEVNKDVKLVSVKEIK